MGPHIAGPSSIKELTMKLFERQYRIQERRWVDIDGCGNSTITYKYYPQIRNLYFGIGIWGYVLGFTPTVRGGSTFQPFPTKEKCEDFINKWKKDISHSNPTNHTID